jgi:hypothetical protein
MLSMGFFDQVNNLCHSSCSSQYDLINVEARCDIKTSSTGSTDFAVLGNFPWPTSRSSSCVGTRCNHSSMQVTWMQLNDSSAMDLIDLFLYK